MILIQSFMKGNRRKHFERRDELQQESQLKDTHENKSIEGATELEMSVDGKHINFKDHAVKEIDPNEIYKNNQFESIFKSIEMPKLNHGSKSIVISKNSSCNGSSTNKEMKLVHESKKIETTKISEHFFASSICSTDENQIKYTTTSSTKKEDLLLKKNNELMHDENIWSTNANIGNCKMKLGKVDGSFDL